MKLKHILPACLAATLTLGFTACNDGDYEVTHLSEVQVSQSYVAIDADGGSTSITVTAKDSWTIDASSADWLTVTPTSGSAGETTVTFSAEGSEDGRSATVTLDCDGATQYINVIQGTSGVTVATCAEVIAGPDAKTYQVTGTVTAIANTTYGNFYLEDETGSIYIYGLMVDGSYPNGTMPFSVGDEVTVSGPKTTYGTTVELVDAELISVNKSLISVSEVENDTIPQEGGTATFTLACSGDGVNVEIPEDAQEWLSIKSINSTSSSAVIVFQASENTGGDRSTAITFTTTDGEKEYTAEGTLVQLGSILEVSIADFNAAAVGDTQYRISGIITSVSNSSRGRFYVTDWSGETYVYNFGDMDAAGIKQYDIVTLVGKRDQYGETIEMTSTSLESVNSVSEISIADVLNAEDNSNVYYLVTGTITEISNETYGNMYISDGNGNSIYIYGLYPGYGATGDNRKYVVANKGLKVGDTLTVVAYKTSYGSTLELAGASYISHVSAE